MQKFDYRFIGDRTAEKMKGHPAMSLARLIDELIYGSYTISEHDLTSDKSYMAGSIRISAEVHEPLGYKIPEDIKSGEREADTLKLLREVQHYLEAIALREST